MATQTEYPPVPPTAQVVGNAFVDQYYHILHVSPELVHRFYQESSVVSRPEPNGVMTSVTTLKGINDKICSLDYKNYNAEIKTADAQESYKDGVIVLVTGCLTGPDSIGKKFTQTFFLAPQNKGYFVLNDIFRYVEDCDPLESSEVIVNGIHDTPLASQPPVPDPEPVHVSDPPLADSTTTTLMDEVQKVNEEAYDPIDNERRVVSEKEATLDCEPQPNENHIAAVTESSSSSAQEFAPKKSYASILSSQTKKGGAGPTKVYVPANTSRLAPKKTEKQSLGLVARDLVPEASAPSASGSAFESGNAHEEVKGHSIYVRNLPLNITVAQLEVEFKKFGPIKQGGVQVRSNKLVVGEVGFLLEEEGFEATALGVAETSLAGGATGEVNLGAAVTFQAEVEVWVGAVEKVIIKEEGEATAEVA
ncbi:nuclear transport factor 2 (NTF2) family protein with RNA binding (RRM-RBD-RNP motifs) domain-containing protein [Actinidia rufa]|uniref:Nuclear transport factor 2 (NTF2) family protein with RNA binding (RRM-RBD-RNP motifs) domain-containing protein n=1 Tax=Actinidia rufa TaxID=165716 RepID=A0A7J0H8X6_9ERIC|nr:nuclear transport factor 2 (NTF2) family protein with RNA binding (RRM-RBD-RNP motifs) domain-containing protein [Actinidia rufa]